MNTHQPHQESTDRPNEAPSDRQRRSGGRSARIQVAVFAATLEMLQEQGYEALSFNGIAERAGINKTSLYRRWETKEQLVLAAIESQVTRDFPLPNTGSLRSDLIHLVRYLAAFLQSAVGSSILQMALTARKSPLIGNFPRDYWQHRYPYLRPLFDRAIARGELSPQTDLRLFFEMLLGILFFHVFILGEACTETLPERIVDLILSGGGTIQTKA
jgi:AcrR family transcriptional regulator